MSTTFSSQLRPALGAMLALTIITGVLYPLVVTVVAQTAFPWQANGSMIQADGARADGEKVVGSALIGQPFRDARYFWSRASATSPAPYNAASSSGSNQGPTNPALIDAVRGRVAALRGADGAGGMGGASGADGMGAASGADGMGAASGAGSPRIPVDLVTASGSGLDPHISPAAAAWQIPRVAAARHIEPSVLQELVRRHTERRQLGLLGEPRVNVLLLNLDLDRATSVPHSAR